MAVRGSEQETIRRLAALARLLTGAGAVAADRAAMADLEEVQQRLEGLRAPTDEPLPEAELDALLGDVRPPPRTPPGRRQH